MARSRRNRINKSAAGGRMDGFLSIEYAIVVLVVVAALVGASIYMKRSLSAQMRSSGDMFGYGRQYEP